MGVTNYEELSNHIGHRLECCGYGGENVAIECLDCHEVLVDFDKVVEEKSNRVKYKGITFYQVGNIWDLVESPEVHNTQTYEFEGSIPKIMGKLKDLFGVPLLGCDRYKTSRQYGIAAEYEGKTYYFTVYDWKEYGVHIGFEHSLLKEDPSQMFGEYDEELENKIEKAFVDLVNNHDKLADFTDRTNYQYRMKYGVKDGSPFGFRGV